MKLSSRAVLRFSLLIVIPLAVILTAVYLYAMGGRYATTENAYVRTDVVAISAEIDGRVARVFVDDNEYVEQGQLLFSINALPFRIELEASKAELDLVRQEVDSLRAGFHENESEIKNAAERVRYLKAEHQRLSKLVESNLTSESILAEAEHDLETARQQAKSLQQRRLKIIADLGGSLDLPIEQHPKYLRAMAQQNRATLDLKRTRVRAPIAGYLGDITLEPGEQVEAGDTVFPLVASGDPWVVANLKEVHVEHVRVGQPAKIRIDSYDNHEFDAVVESLSPATGAEFSLLPAQNATGNWVKVVQRVPVKLRIKRFPDMPVLRAGLTATVEIDTGYERPIGSALKASLASIGIRHE